MLGLVPFSVSCPFPMLLTKFRQFDNNRYPFMSLSGKDYDRIRTYDPARMMLYILCRKQTETDNERESNEHENRNPPIGSSRRPPSPYC